MAGLAPAMMRSGASSARKTSGGEKPSFHKTLQLCGVDGRVKPGHDDRGSMACERSQPTNSERYKRRIAPRDGGRGERPGDRTPSPDRVPAQFTGTSRHGGQSALIRANGRSKDGRLQPNAVSMVGANRPNAISAAPITPRPTLNQISAAIPVMIAAEASTMAIWMRPLPSS